MMNWNALYDHLRQRAPSLELRRDEPMSRHTTFRVGGPASLMALPKTVGEAKAVLKAAHDLKAELFFLGNGSNLLVSDRGTDRFVVKLSGRLERGAGPGTASPAACGRSTSSWWTGAAVRCPNWLWPRWTGGCPGWSSPRGSPGAWAAVST